MADWVVGAEVVERSSSWGPVWRYGAVRKIGKVHKNGNFVLEGESQQWRPLSDYAVKTSDRGFYSSSTRIVLMTDEAKADMELAAAYAAAAAVVRAEAERLERVYRGNDVDETIAEAAKINTGKNK